MAAKNSAWSLIWLCLLCIGLAACSQERGAPSLEYSSSASEVVIFADENTTPGGFVLGQECNHLPRLRVWGDGRTIYAPIENGQRRVLAGQTSPETIQKVLQALEDVEYFTNPPENLMSRTGTGYRLSIHLKDGSFDSFWSDPNAVYDNVLTVFDPASLAPYTPETGYLVVGPRLRAEAISDPPEWPARFSYRLSDPAASGREVTGEELAFLWDAINRQPEPLTGVRDGDGIYAVALFVDGVSLGEPPFRCWNK